MGQSNRMQSKSGREDRFLPCAPGEWVLLGLTVLHVVVSLFWTGKNDRLMTLIEVVLMGIWLIYALLYAWWWERVSTTLCTLVGGLYFLSFFRKAFFFHFTEQVGMVVRLMIAGYGGILLVAVIWIARRVRKKPSTRKRKTGKLIEVILITAFLALTVLYVSPGHLNYALDTTPPTVIYTTVVACERVRGGRRAPDHYYLTVLVEGREERIKVRRGVYRQFEMGDSVTVMTHEGAFGWTYVTIEEHE